MRPNNSGRPFRSINAAVDKNGRIHGCLSTSEPIKGIVCVWPRFPVLPPPVKTKSALEDASRESHSASRSDGQRGK